MENQVKKDNIRFNTTDEWKVKALSYIERQGYNKSDFIREAIEEKMYELPKIPASPKLLEQIKKESAKLNVSQDKFFITALQDYIKYLNKPKLAIPEKTVIKEVMPKELEKELTEIESLVRKLKIQEQYQRIDNLDTIAKRLQAIRNK